jgi:hypothetical protein
MKNPCKCKNWWYADKSGNCTEFCTRLKLYKAWNDFILSIWQERFYFLNILKWSYAILLALYIIGIIT